MGPRGALLLLAMFAGGTFVAGQDVSGEDNAGPPACLLECKTYTEVELVYSKMDEEVPPSAMCASLIASLADACMSGCKDADITFINEYKDGQCKAAGTSLMDNTNMDGHDDTDGHDGHDHDDHDDHDQEDDFPSCLLQCTDFVTVAMKYADSDTGAPASETCPALKDVLADACMSGCSDGDITFITKYRDEQCKEAGMDSGAVEEKADLVAEKAESVAAATTKADTAAKNAEEKRAKMLVGIKDANTKKKAELLAKVSESGEKVQKVDAKVTADSADDACKMITDKIESSDVVCEATKVTSRRMLLADSYDTTTFAPQDVEIIMALTANGIAATVTEADPIAELKMVSGIDTTALAEYETASIATVTADAEKTAAENAPLSSFSASTMASAFLAVLAVGLSALLA